VPNRAVTIIFDFVMWEGPWRPDCRGTEAAATLPGRRCLAQAFLHEKL